jgi:hypothetical protein
MDLDVSTFPPARLAALDPRALGQGVERGLADLVARRITVRTEIVEHAHRLQDVV